MKGRQIKNLDELVVACTLHRAITVPGTNWEKPKPAACLINLTGKILFYLFLKGMFIYEKPVAAIEE